MSTATRNVQQRNERDGLPSWLAELIQKAVEFVELDIGLEKALRLSGSNGSSEPFELTYRLAGMGLPREEIHQIFYAAGHTDTVREAIGFAEVAVAGYAENGEEKAEAEKKAETALFIALSGCYRNRIDGQHRWPAVSQSEMRGFLLEHFGTAPEAKDADFKFFAVLAAARRLIAAKRRTSR